MTNGDNSNIQIKPQPPNPSDAFKIPPRRDKKNFAERVFRDLWLEDRTKGPRSGKILRLHGGHRTRPSVWRQRVFEKAGRDPREGKHFPLLVGFGAKSQVITVIEKPKFSRSNHQTIKLTWAATIFHPLNILTHVCCCRPILSVPSRRNSVLAIAMSSPNVVIVVLIKSRSSP